MPFVAGSFVLPAVALGFGAAAIALWIYFRRLLQGTTLLAAWWWMLLSLGVLAISEAWLLAGDVSPAVSQSVRFLTATSSFCPLMAVLGARRPQHQAWTFVVATLWGILAMPAAEKLLLQPNQPLEIRDARSWFLLLLLAISWANYLPTRYGAAACLAGAGQTLVLWPYLPWTSPQAWELAPLVGLGCCAAAIGLATWIGPGREAATGADRLWFDFRNLYGALWALRGLEQFNTSAEQNDWPVRLGWSGFQATQEEQPAALPAPARQAWANILRRFLPQERIGRESGLQLD
ncbi:hypothetical protein [Lignipirellula cremea]|uniref:Uncharacterized protein n=1 Tax=Lignipirellula cremea TaxID=2528010 RepID=A0A518DMR7_9BACT|nr:hypothetical protein [Lignipirellula cremea]QDU93137.1 hypothetical protein Pla8534_09160 [Lignipirellula cremea]